MSQPGIQIKIEVEKLQQNKIMIATPMYGGQCAGMYTKSIAALSALVTAMEWTHSSISCSMNP
jgi:hypothetical protein